MSRLAVYLALAIGGVALGIAIAESTHAFAGGATVWLMALLPGLVGTLLWVTQGGSIGTALRWVIPITVLLVIAASLPVGIVSWAITIVALLFMGAMLFSADARRRWFGLFPNRPG